MSAMTSDLLQWILWTARLDVRAPSDLTRNWSQPCVFLLYEFVSVPQPKIEKTKMKNSKKTGPSRSESVPSPEKSKPLPGMEEIRERAYEIFLARESSAGDAVSDWFQAERELKQKRPRAG
jgi:hypothetical protein